MEYIEIIGRSHSLLSGVINQAKNDFACLLMELVHILENYVRSEEEKKREREERMEGGDTFHSWRPRPS